MSDTTTNPLQETTYESLSEASDNDNRDDLVLPEDTQEAAAEAPEAPQAEAAEAAPEAEEPTEDEAAARAARLARDLREQKRRARQLEAENQALRGERNETRDEQIEREVQQRAAAMAQQNAINKACNDIYNQGVKEYGRTEFDTSVQAINEAFGAQLMPMVLETLTDLPDAQKLLHYLGENPDKLDDLANLPPHRLGAALAKEATKLAQPKPKQISKAPQPIKPIPTRSAAEPETDLEKMSMEQLAAMWDKRDWERRFR